jgi:hypothetical protein
MKLVETLDRLRDDGLASLWLLEAMQSGSHLISAELDGAAIGVNPRFARVAGLPR